MNRKAENLFNKLIRSDCTREEAEKIVRFLADKKKYPLYSDIILSQLLQELREDEKKWISADRLDDIFTKIPPRRNFIKRPGLFKFSYHLKYVSIIVLLLTLGIIVYFSLSHRSMKKETLPVASQIKPGANKAILTLSNGQKINLSDSIEGIFAEETGVKISMTSKGQVTYEFKQDDNIKSTIENVKPVTPSFNIIETPRGGQYKVKLPDGSTVFLNAASVLKFPTTFSSNERKVELSGEAYFEVKPLQITSVNQATSDESGLSAPFIVKTKTQEIKVLGTHFNVSAYPDEMTTKTTLLKGKVNVSAMNGTQSATLNPGQEADTQEGGNSIEIVNVDPSFSVAWKNGLFVFEDEPIINIMQRISRWYSVDIEYENIDVKKRFGGSVSRYDNVTKVLRQMELTDQIHFKINGRRIIVMD